MPGTADRMTRRGFSETRILWLVAAVQFVNILDFMMVMPLGPDLSQALGIPTSALGMVGGSYTAAAAASGVLSASLLDRFDRRPALVLCLLGLVVGTAAGGFATGLPSLLAARLVAGAFGGPATSLALSIVADVIPPARRGRAMGIVMGAFSVASVLGVPAGLELARLFDYRAPFFAVAALGALVTMVAAITMPPLTSHLPATSQGGAFALLKRPAVVLSLTATAVAMVANYLLIPNLPAFWLFNRDYPREGLGLLYLAGGVVSFFTLRLSGWLVDRVGPSRVSIGGTALYVTTLVVGFALPAVQAPVMPIFVAFMVTGSFRMVPMQALSSRVPAAAERARFMSLQSAVQHTAAAAAAMLGSRLLTERRDHALVGMETLALCSAVFSLALPILLWVVEAHLKERERAAPPPGVEPT